MQGTESRLLLLKPLTADPWLGGVERSGQQLRLDLVFVRKLRKAYGKSEWNTVERLKDNKPNYKLDHIIKERELQGTRGGQWRLPPPHSETRQPSCCCVREPSGYVLVKWLLPSAVVSCGEAAPVRSGGGRGKTWLEQWGIWGGRRSGAPLAPRPNKTHWPHRYPTFIDALRDLDDALSMCFLFSTFPRTGKCHVQTIQLCRRLTVEFMHYIIASRALRKVFLSIKGIYYQAEVLGQPIVWITPYAFSHDGPSEHREQLPGPYPACTPSTCGATMGTVTEPCSRTGVLIPALLPVAARPWPSGLASASRSPPVCPTGLEDWGEGDAQVTAWQESSGTAESQGHSQHPW
ncbi:hypothetical protein P7K49_002764 [Saguinus oedipus]|uniref:Uncharacterized protein n=1 Tax=Saguinus oedipus TaxID=9490 RepID=A0ABQ9WI94_SAGOE|nr:hypothetical protein P7K49_002764 [Saguinus oedipus]